MHIIKNRRVWSIGYLGVIGFFGYNWLTLNNYEPWRCYSHAQRKIL
jgi:hypothetical protein